MPDVFIPLVNGERHRLELEAGRMIFVLGPNGSGKSSLMQHLANQIKDTDLLKWIRAYRRSWIDSNVLDLTPAQFQERQRYHASYMRQAEARYRTDDDSFDAKSSIASLIQKQNSDARKIKMLLRQGQDSEARILAQEGDVLHTLNAALQQSNIQVAVSIGNQDDILATKQGSTYGIDEMSDGERSVILLAASILTASSGTHFLVDEPERHLHRAIISPLLSTLFRARSDCRFVVSTHEVALAVDNPEGDVVLVRECRFSGRNPAMWDLDVIRADQDIPEHVRVSILGARRKIIFVEGDRSSLDCALYARVFPGVSIVPVGSNSSVKDSVRSIRSLSKFHGVHAFGIVDRDHHDEADILELEQHGIFAIDGYAVESIYYDTNVQRMVIEGTVLSEKADEHLRDAKERALRAFKQSARHICEGRVKSKRHDRALIDLHKADLTESTLQLYGAEALQEEEERLAAMVEAGDVDSLIRRYPVKRSPARSEIAKALGLRDRRVYESAVVQLLGNSDDALSYVRKRFARLLCAMEEGDASEMR